MSTLEDQIRAIADEAFAQTEPIVRAPRTTADEARVHTEPVSIDTQRGRNNRARLLAVAATVLGIALVGGLLAASNRSADPVPADEPPPTIGTPTTRSFEGVPLIDIAISPTADRIAAARADEICVISTSPEAPPDSDRCYPFPSGVGQGSLTWSPDATSVVFHHDFYRNRQEPDLVQLDLSSGELTVLTEDGVSERGGDSGDIDLAPTFGPDGQLFFFRVDGGDVPQSVLLEYDGDGAVTATGSVVAGLPGVWGRRLDGSSIVTPFTVGDGAAELVSVDIDGGPTRTIRFEGPVRAVTGAARDRALLVLPESSGNFELSVADFSSGVISPIELGQLESSMRVTGAGLSPDGTRIAIIVADEGDPDGHRLLVADIADDSTVDEFTVLATGPQFVPDNGDRRTEPAGIGLLREIAWTDTSLVYALGPNEIVTLPLR